MRVGFVGLGAMGNGMARNLHRAGLLVGVFNRTVAKAQALAAELKLTAYPTVQALGADVDAVVSCVSADADVLEVARALAPALSAAACCSIAPPSVRKARARRRRCWSRPGWSSSTAR